MKTYSVQAENNSYNDDLYNGTLKQCRKYIDNDDNLNADNSQIAYIEINQEGCVVDTLKIIEIEKPNKENMKDMINHNGNIRLFISENAYYWEICDDNTSTYYNKQTDKDKFLAGLNECKIIIYDWFQDEASEQTFKEIEYYICKIEDIIEELKNV